MEKVINEFIEEYVEDNKSPQLLELYQHLLDRSDGDESFKPMVSSRTSKDFNESGYFEFITELIEVGVHLLKGLEKTGKNLSFSIPEFVKFVLIYRVGIFYRVEDSQNNISVRDRTTFLLQKFNIILNEDEYLAVSGYIQSPLRSFVVSLEEMVHRIASFSLHENISEEYSQDNNGIEFDVNIEEDQPENFQVNEKSDNDDEEEKTVEIEEENSESSYEKLDDLDMSNDDGLDDLFVDFDDEQNGEVEEEEELDEEVSEGAGHTNTPRKELYDNVEEKLEDLEEGDDNELDSLFDKSDDVSREDEISDHESEESDHEKVAMEEAEASFEELFNENR